MGRKTFLKNFLRLRQIQAETGRLVREVSVEDPLIAGCLSEVRRTCGKPNCRCARQPCHPCVTLLTKYRGKRRCQVVRKADVANIRLKVVRYRRFREVLRRLKVLDLERTALLKGILEDRAKEYR